jgi:hypothetical protein
MQTRVDAAADPNRGYMPGGFISHLKGPMAPITVVSALIGGATTTLGAMSGVRSQAARVYRIGILETVPTELNVANSLYGGQRREYRRRCATWRPRLRRVLVHGGADRLSLQSPAQSVPRSPRGRRNESHGCPRRDAQDHHNSQRSALKRSGSYCGPHDRRMLSEPELIRRYQRRTSTPALTEAQVSFHTNDKDKDDDTHVTVTVRQGDGTIAARIDDDFGHFNDHSNNGPFGLLILNPADKTDLSRTIRIDPNGNDTWRFNFLVDLVFADSSHLNTEANSLELTQERQQQTFAIQ